MRSTGIVRRIDELGRVVLPIELRRHMDMDERQPLEVFVQGNDTVILRIYNPGCAICGDLEGVQEVNMPGGSRRICKDCAIAIAVNHKDAKAAAS